MKMRLGFVPNSSSSSFIIVFPRIPRSLKEMFEFLFGDSEETDFVTCWGDKTKLTLKEAAAIVFRDIKDKESKGTPNRIKELMAQRYYYSAYGNYNSGFGYAKKDFWGSDMKLVDKIRELSIKQDELDKEYRKQEIELLDSNTPAVPYASDYKDSKGKRSYTDKQIAAYKKYMVWYSKFIASDPKYKALQKGHFKAFGKIHNDIRELDRKLAEKDFKAFRKKVKDGVPYILNYADDNHPGSIMEHGDALSRVAHIVVSHH